MTEFVKPKVVAEINVVMLNGEIKPGRYQTMDDFYGALTRANVSKPSGTYFQFQQSEMENGVLVAWLAQVERKDTALQEPKKEKESKKKE